jgi:hypothetical protein
VPAAATWVLREQRGLGGGEVLVRYVRESCGSGPERSSS